MTPTPLTEERQKLFITELRNWTNATKKQMLFRLAAMGMHAKVNARKSAEGRQSQLAASIKGSVKMRGGDIDAIRFSFLYYGIFLEHGVGKGRKRESAAAVANKRPWIQPSLGRAYYVLADHIANNYADMAVGNIRIIVPGIINTTIKT